jgi:hypothetical protein
MHHDEAHFNLLHSRTRIIVERAFARWKNKFRLFKTELLHHKPEGRSDLSSCIILYVVDMARLIEATMILHNWIIDLHEFDNPDEAMEDIQIEAWMHIGGDIPMISNMNLVSGEPAEYRRNLLKNWLSCNILL